MNRRFYLNYQRKKKPSDATNASSEQRVATSNYLPSKNKQKEYSRENISWFKKYVLSNPHKVLLAGSFPCNMYRLGCQEWLNSDLQTEIHHLC
jgi:hypothetical protein